MSACTDNIHVVTVCMTPN